MPKIGLDSSSVFWDLYVENTSVNSILRKSIEKIDIEYSISSPTKAQITINSPYVIEDFFRDGAKVRIEMGYSRILKAKMIDGVTVGRPMGEGSESLNINVKVLDNITSMTRSEKNKTFNMSPTKSNIVNQIISTNGFTPQVSIADTKTLKPESIPKQVAMTDLEFLYMLAKRWNCAIWADTAKNIIYFYDSTLAHDAGATQKLANINDLSPDYMLNFRTKYNDNNVARVSWSQKSQKSSGAQVSFGADRTGKQFTPSDYEIENEGQIWQLKQEIVKEMKTNPHNAAKYLQIIGAAKVSETKELLRKYFKPITAKDDSYASTNEQAGHSKGMGGLTVSVEMTKGDPYLRCPRKALLTCGDGSRGSMDLPQFLFRDSRDQQKYNINTVKTSLTSGMIQTNLEMTMGFK